MKVIEELKWKSFTLVVNADEDGEDDAQNIAKKLTMAAIQKGLCVLVYDGDQDGTSHLYNHLPTLSSAYCSRIFTIKLFTPLAETSLTFLRELIIVIYEFRSLSNNLFSDLTTHIVHIGTPEDGFFSKPINSTVLVVSEGRLEGHLNHVNSTNSILLLEDSR